MKNYERVENWSRHQEKGKSRKDNKLCRKSRDNSGRSRDSTKKSIEKNEEVDQ